MKDLKSRFDVLADGADNVTLWFKELVEDARHFKDELGSLTKAAAETHDAFKGAPQAKGGGGSAGVSSSATSNPEAQSHSGERQGSGADRSPR